MTLMLAHKVARSVKLLTAVVGCGAVVVMAALSLVAGERSQTATATGREVPAAPAPHTTVSSVLATPFASPTFTASPCAPRQTMPC